MVHFTFEFHVLEMGSVEMFFFYLNKLVVLPPYAHVLVLPDGNEYFPAMFYSGAKAQGRKLKEFAINSVASDCCLPGQVLSITYSLAALPSSPCTQAPCFP